MLKSFNVTLHGIKDGSEVAQTVTIDAIDSLDAIDRARGLCMFDLVDRVVKWSSSKI